MFRETVNDNFACVKSDIDQLGHKSNNRFNEMLSISWDKENRLHDIAMQYMQLIDEILIDYQYDKHIDLSKAKDLAAKIDAAFLNLYAKEGA